MTGMEPDRPAASPPDAGLAVAGAGGLAEIEPELPARVPKRNVAAIWIVAFGVGISSVMPALVVIPVMIARISPENKDTVLGAVLGIQAFVGMAFAPLFGALSDRTTSRFGMRRPWLAAGSIGIIGGLFVLGMAASIPMIFLGVIMMAVGGSITSPVHALTPDSIPDHYRGRVLGINMLIGVGAGLIAAIVGPMFLNDELILFGGGAVMLAVCMVIALLLIRDRHLDPRDVPREPLLRVLLAAYKVNPKESPDFSWVFASRFVITLGIAFTTTFMIYFLTDQLHVTEQQLPPLITLNAILGLVGVGAGSLVGAILADKIPSRKRLVLTCAILIAVGAVIVAFSSSVPMFYIGSAIVTFAGGMFIPTDGTLVMTVLPGGDKHAAKYMAIITIADQLPRSIGPFVAPAVIALGAHTALGGYPLLYLAAAVAAIIGGLLVRNVRSVR
ncbi:MFS transporter [Nonomuraea basaltis]|uniref:MFS transporter n=1 Tax=Nonomuraea basaltis TaxID=2495887 RepID=UPI00110C466F|nr:MFS transporter [Nonomuraea basaltis]TMR91014.1 MFS transporter [Nonomuraea basaltis]